MVEMVLVWVVCRNIPWEVDQGQELDNDSWRHFVVVGRVEFEGAWVAALSAGPM
jgi:hypothetical protein